MTGHRTRSSAQFVVKLSKYCNLRCTYCYEYPELGNRQRMQLGQLRTFFETVRDHALENAFGSLDLVWHGGEPFLVPLDYYAQIQGLQQQIFADAIPITNVVQTNLTVLTEGHLRFLKAGAFFRGIGVSFDVYGDQRIDTAGKLRTDTIIANLQQLIESRVPFGAISVLARNTLAHARSIYKFWDDLNIEFRFLPFYMSAFTGQVSAHALAVDEIEGAFAAVFAEWLASERATLVEPIAEYVRYAVAHLEGERDCRYRKQDEEAVFLVDTDGGVWGAGDAYAPALSYGNVFRQSFTDVLASPVRRRVVEACEQRLARFCGACPYHGACPGTFVADATPEQIAGLEHSGCTVRRMLERIVAALERSGIGEEIKRRHRPVIDNRALSVNL